MSSMGGKSFTCAPYIEISSRFDSAVSTDTHTSASNPARAQYAARATPTLPEDTVAKLVLPSSAAFEIPIEI